MKPRSPGPQQSRGYSWPPTPPRWTREEQKASAQRKEQHEDLPIIVSDSDSEHEADTTQTTQRTQQLPQPHSPQPPASSEQADRQQETNQRRDQRGNGEVRDSSTASSHTASHGNQSRAMSDDAATSSEGEEEEGEEEEESKAHDSEETEDEDNVAMEEATASNSVVQDVRNVQHEDFSASQRELQVEAAGAAAATAETAQLDAQPQMEATGDVPAQQCDKRRHDSISGVTEQPAGKQAKLSPVNKSKHDNHEPMIDAVHTTASISRPSPLVAITPATHTYFAPSPAPAPSSAASSVQSQSPHTTPASTTQLVGANLSQQPSAVSQKSPSTSSSGPSSNTSPSLSPTNPAVISPPAQSPQPPPPHPALKLLRSVTHCKQRDKPPLTLNLSPQTTLFYYDPDTCPRPSTGPLPHIKRTTKKQRTQLAVYQLLQRQEELEEELAAADEAMEKDEQAGKEVAERWEKRIDALQEEMDEIEDELEAREVVERERDRKEREAWYRFSRLGATEEEVRRTDEEDAKAAAELGDDGCDGMDDSEESAEEEEGGDEEESKTVEVPTPTSPPSNPFEQAERPAAAHFKKALNEWQEYYHVNEDEFKRATESVWAQGGFVSGLYFEKGRKEEVKGGKQSERKEQQKTEQAKEEEKKEGQCAGADSSDTTANKENVPVAGNSPKLSPLAPVSSPPAVAFPPVRSTKSVKQPVTTAPSLFSKSVSPPPVSSAATPPPSTTAPSTSSSPAEPRPAVRPAAISSFFSAASSSSSSSSSTPRGTSTSARRVVGPQLIRPANLVANGGLPPTSLSNGARAVLHAGVDNTIDLTDDD